MSVFNGERDLVAAIQSILDQSFRDFELLIMNDGSTDGTGALLERFARSDNRVKIFESPKNRGLTKCLNDLLSEAQGEYVARMDADDVSLPERLAKQVAWMDSQPDVGVVGAAYQAIDMDDQKGMTFQFENDHHFLRWYLCFQNPLAHPTIMARTALLRSAGGYREEFSYGQDYDLWWRLSFLTRLSCLSEPLILLRRNPAGVSSLHRKEQMASKMRVLLEMLPKLGIYDALELVSGAATENPRAQAQLVRRVYEVFSAKEDIPRRTRDLIRLDASARLAVCFLKEPGSPGILWNALEIDPLLPARALGQGARRMIANSAKNPIIR